MPAAWQSGSGESGNDPCGIHGNRRAVNVMWAGPWSSRHQDEVLAKRKRTLAWRRWRKGNSSKRLWQLGAVHRKR